MKSAISILGCGWLGKPLAIHFLAQGYPINGSTTAKNKLVALSSVGITPFLLQMESLNPSITEFLETEILIVNIPSKNIKSFQNLIVEIEKSSIKKVLFVSSTSIYEQSTEIITEKSAVNNSSLVQIETLFSLNSHFSTSIIRFSGLMGYNRHPGRFFAPGRHIINPDGVVNMIHRDDCIAIIDRIITMDIWNETFNACADLHPSRREFYSKAALEIGFKVPEFIQTSSSDLKLISNQKLKSLLNYEFKYPNLLKALQADLSRSK